MKKFTKDLIEGATMLFWVLVEVFFILFLSSIVGVVALFMLTVVLRLFNINI